MATRIIRYSNSYAFQIYDNYVDYSTDKVIVEDYATPSPTTLYAVLDKKNYFSYKHELYSHPIKKTNFKFTMSGNVPITYTISATEKVKLLSKGICTAVGKNEDDTATVYAGLKIANFLNEEGKKALQSALRKLMNYEPSMRIAKPK